MPYFEEVVLPSVGLPLKPSYNLREGCDILCCQYSQLAKLVDKGLIKITSQKRIYATEFKKFFRREHKLKVKK